MAVKTVLTEEDVNKIMLMTSLSKVKALIATRHKEAYARAVAEEEAEIENGKRWLDYMKDKCPKLNWSVFDNATNENFRELYLAIEEAEDSARDHNDPPEADYAPHIQEVIDMMEKEQGYDELE